MTYYYSYYIILFCIVSYFGIKLGDKDNSWAPHKACVEDRRNWSRKEKQAIDLLFR